MVYIAGDVNYDSLPFPFCENFFPSFGKEFFFDLVSMLVCIAEEHGEEDHIRKTDIHK